MYRVAFRYEVTERGHQGMLITLKSELDAATVPV